MFDFDKVDLDALHRRPGAKWARHGPGVIASWVADMDFDPAPAVAEALHALIDAGDLGYPNWLEGHPLLTAFVDRMDRRFGWVPDLDRVRAFTDVVQGIEVAVHVATEPGDGVALHTPIYPPFLNALANTGRRLVDHPLDADGGRWTLDPDRLRHLVTDEGCRAVVMSNPHNPTGRVFTRAELEGLAEVVVEHDLLMVSDEIWADLVYEGEHLPFAAIAEEVADRTVTFNSATKSFNLAAVRTAVAHLGDQRVRRGLDTLPAHALGSVSTIGVAATLAAWTGGDEWLAGLVAHLDRQRHLLVELVDERLPGVETHLPEATYLGWLDCRALELEREAWEFFLDGGVALGKGPDFGDRGVGFVRVNFATSSAVLTEIVDRMAAAIAAR